MQTIRQWLNTWLEIAEIPKSKRPDVIKALRTELKELKDLTLPLDSLPLEMISKIRVRLYEIRQTLKGPRKSKPGINRRKSGRRVSVDRKTEQQEQKSEDDEEEDDDVDEG